MPSSGSAGRSKTDGAARKVRKIAKSTFGQMYTKTKKKRPSLPGQAYVEEE